MATPTSCRSHSRTTIRCHRYSWRARRFTTNAATRSTSASGVPQHTHAGPVDLARRNHDLPGRVQVRVPDGRERADVRRRDVAATRSCGSSMSRRRRSSTPRARRIGCVAPTGRRFVDWIDDARPDGERRRTTIALYSKAIRRSRKLGIYEGRAVRSTCGARSGRPRSGSSTHVLDPSPAGGAAQISQSDRPRSIGGHVADDAHTARSRRCSNVATSNDGARRCSTCRVVQQTAEPIVLSLIAARPTGSFSETTIATSKATATNGPQVSCPVTCPGGVNGQLLPVGVRRCEMLWSRESDEGDVVLLRTDLQLQRIHDARRRRHRRRDAVLATPSTASRSRAVPPPIRRTATIWSKASPRWAACEPVRAQDYAIAATSYTGTAPAGSPTYSCNELVINPTGSGFYGVCMSYSTLHGDHRGGDAGGLVRLGRDSVLDRPDGCQHRARGRRTCRAAS